MTTLLRLLKLIAPFRWWMALGVLLSFATTGASVGLMAMSAYLISKAAVVDAVVDLSADHHGRALLRHLPAPRCATPSAMSITRPPFAS